MLADGILDAIFPRNQSAYDRVARDQAEVTALLAELNSIGRSAWDEVQGRTAGAIRDGYQLPIERLTDFAWTNDDLLAQARSLMITNSTFPSNQDVSTAESRIGLYRSMVEYVKSILPELAGAAQAEGDEMRARVLAMPLHSPADVGLETFRNELARRAKELGNVGMGVGMVAVIAIAAIAAARMFGGGR